MFHCPLKGFLKDVDTLMKMAAIEYSEQDKAVGIQFDEVHLKQDISYDIAEDEINGPYWTANVMIMRGLFRNYKVVMIIISTIRQLLYTNLIHIL